jgi:uncharacterized protein YqeY
MQKAIKKRRESSAAFKAAGRHDLLEIEETEILILQEFLPKQITNESIQIVIDNVMKEINATSLRDIGKVMKLVQMKIDVSVAPTKLVAELVKKSLELLD